MESLAALYHITPENLALRRAFIGLDDELVALLADLRPWGDEVADAIAAEVTDHHFRSSGTADFFRTYAAERGVEFATLRAEWHEARGAHWRRIFAEPGRPQPFGIEYFDKLLEAGAGYNRMNLPMKWYLGRYPAYLDAVRRQLRENPPQIPGAEGRRRRLLRRGDAAVDPAVLADTERAIGIVFNYDLQAITDAFYFDTFATMGVDLAAVRKRGVVTDLSDRSSELKSTVHESLRLFVDSSQSMHDVFAQVRGNVDQTSDAMNGIAAASAEVAQGAERQALMLQRSRELADEVSAATARAQELGNQGVDAAVEANGVMQRVRVSGQEAQAGIDELARKSNEIGGILETITGIADQTNLLALNAAIEAARAGEHGRGFAVVAEQVRKLAEESGGSATTIADLVKEIQQEIDRVVNLVQQAAALSDHGVERSALAQQAFGDIGDAIAAISDSVDGMTEASTEIATVAEQSSASAEEMSSATQQTSAQSHELSASLADLATTADRLLEASQQFSVTD